MLEQVKQYKTVIIIVASILIVFAAFGLGYRSGYGSGYRNGYDKGKSEAKVTNNEIKIPGEATTETKTVIQYVPKVVDAITKVPEKTDIEANIGKPELTVKVNGQTQVVQKEASEKYALEKNKLTLDQTSKATFEVKVPVIDNTRKWAVGVGYGNHGLAGKIDFPVKRPIGGWVYGDRKTIAAGIQVNF